VKLSLPSATRTWKSSSFTISRTEAALFTPRAAVSTVTVTVSASSAWLCRLNSSGNSVPKRPIVWYHDFRYQAANWQRLWRVVVKVDWHSGELFPRVGVVKFYNRRGTAEQSPPRHSLGDGAWIKKGK